MPGASIRLGGVGVLAIALAISVCAPSPAQRPRPSKSGTAEETKFTEAVTLPRNPESKRLIQAAQDYVKKQEWRIAGECLQSLLDSPEDSFIEVVRKNARGQEMTVRVSVRAEANRIIGELPADGLESYQVQYGQVAAERLKEAIEKADPALLAEVSQRYFNTKPGLEATHLLGTYQLDRGQHLMASLCFERLLNRADANQLPAKILFKAALAYRRAGNGPVAEKTFARFTEQLGREPGKSRLTVEQFRSEFSREVGGNFVTALNDWPMFRGNAARMAQSKGSTAYLEPRWTANLYKPEEPPHPIDMPAVQWVEQHLDQAIALMRDRPILSASFPIAANGMVFVRTYDGVAAYSVKDEPSSNKKAGDLEWRQPAENSLFTIVRDDSKGKRQKLQEWYTNYYLANNAGPIGVLFENSILGSISHDGQRVYFIDDLAVPPHPSQMHINAAFGGMPMNFAPFNDEVQCNKLVAAKIDGGSLSWNALGGRSGTRTGPPAEGQRDLNAATELQDTFFLGPPLPLGGKLYLMTEKQSELRLICLDPNKMVPSAIDAAAMVPEILWIQSLGTANEKLPMDGQRRMQAAHLAYGDGILVCPTNAGAVVGVDLLSHSLVWAFSYRKVQQQNNNDEVAMFNRGMGRFRPSQPMGERWRPSAPCVVQGKVLFTAPDSGELHCLNLRDGQLLWSAKRDETDLYFAGAFDDRAIIVSKNHVRALHMDTGKEIWKRTETGVPSGQGVAAEGTYYLPLAVSHDPNTSDKGPEICAIDIKTGNFVGRSKSRKETPGNLLFLDGELVAQNVRTVSSFPLLKVKQAEINEAIARNPKDPKGLCERGELHLYNGAVKESVADLRQSLANQPPPDIKDKARSKLHEAFTVLCKDDFAGAEKYLEEYAELCQLVLPPDADAVATQKARAEHVRRRAIYLELVGRGREKQGRLLDAFIAYEQYGELTGHKELVDSVDEPTTKARPDIWSRGRIQALLNNASATDRKMLEGEISKRWSIVRGDANVDRLRKFVALYGPISATGKAARLELAERLLQSGESDDVTEAERILATLCLAGRNRRDDPMSAGRATELMIQICIRRGRYENAVGYCRQLAEEFPDTPVREGMTGRQMFELMSTDKRFLPYLETPTSVWTGPLSAEIRRGPFSNRESTSITLHPQGELMPFFERHRLVLDQRNNEGGPILGTLRMLDRVTGEERWKIASIPNYVINANQPPSSNIMARGNLLIVQANEWVIAADVSDRRELWRYNLLGKDANLPSESAKWQMELAGGDFAISPDQRKVTIGRVAIVEPAFVAVQGRDGLIAIDPTRNGISKLWVKTDVSTKASVFGDDRHVFIFDRDAPSGRKFMALRAQDGMPVNCADFSEFYKKKHRIMGGRILVVDDSGQAIRLMDALTCEEIWRRNFAAGTVIVNTDEKLIGAIDPSGKFTLLNADDGATRLEYELGADRAQKLKDATLVQDRNRYYLALNRRPESAMQWSCALPTARSARVNGKVIALNRKTGQFEWATHDDLPYQTLILEQLQELPVLVCASSYTRSTPNNSVQGQGVKIAMIDKSNGKMIIDKDLVSNTNFYSLVANSNAGRIELTRQDVKIVVTTPEAALSSDPPNREGSRPVNRVVPAPIAPVPAPRGGQ